MRMSQQLHLPKKKQRVLWWQRGFFCSLAVAKSLFFLLGLPARHYPKSRALWDVEAPGFPIDSTNVHNRLRNLNPESFPGPSFPGRGGHWHRAGRCLGSHRQAPAAMPQGGLNHWRCSAGSAGDKAQGCPKMGSTTCAAPPCYPAPSSLLPALHVVMAAGRGDKGCFSRIWCSGYLYRNILK